MFTPMDPAAQAFMNADSRQTPMHVAGLHLFELPDGADRQWVRETYDASLDVARVARLYLKHPYRSLRTAGIYGWTDDEQFDLEYHVRLSALPTPGRVRELLELTGQLHGTRLALERPLWEAHFIEGLADGRLAVYTKLHHALVDGVAAMRLLQATLSSDPGDRDTPPPWASRAASERAEQDQLALAARLWGLPLGTVRSTLAVLAEAAGLPGALLTTLDRSLRNQAAPVSFRAPRTVLNQRITGARRVAAQQWPIERVRAVGKASDATVNDVVLAMCSGALRTYLDELGSLPPQPLVAMVPVSLRRSDPDQGDTASEEGGNAIGTLMVSLATHLGDPADRLAAIHSSVRSGRAAMATLSQAQILAMSALGMSGLIPPLLGLPSPGGPPFNLVISNVPGPRRPLYLNGAKLTDVYPLSIPTHGLAMNITCTSYEGMMNFGLTGCRRTLPHLQRLLGHLDGELSRLEQAAGVA